MVFPGSDTQSVNERAYWGPKQSTFTPWERFTLSDVKWAALKELTGTTFPASIADMELLWLKQQAGLPAEFPASITDLYATVQANQQAEELNRSALLLFDLREEAQSVTKAAITNRGTLGTAGNAQLGSTASPDTNDPIWLPWRGEDYFWNARAANNWFFHAPTPAIDPATINKFQVVVRTERSNWNEFANERLFWAQAASGEHTFSWSISAGNLIWNYNNFGPSCQVAVGGFGVNAPHYFRATYTRNVEIKMEYSFDEVTWNFLAVNNVGIAPVAFNINSMWFGSDSTYTNNWQAPLYVCKVYINDVLYTNPKPKQFVETTGASDELGRSWGFNRPQVETGLMSAAVTRPVLVMAADDYLVIPNNAAHNFGAGDSFTALVALRTWGGPNTQIYFANRSFADGWQVNRNAPSVYPIFIGATGGASYAVSGATVPFGKLTVFGGVRDVAKDTAQVFNEGSGGQSMQDPTGSLVSGNPICIGQAPSAGLYANLEFVGAGLWKRALTPTEIQAWTDWIKTPPSPVGALLSQAELFLDARNYSGSGSLINQGKLGSAGDAQLGTVAGADTNDPLWLPYTNEKYVYIPGSGDNFLDAPSYPSIFSRLANDLDIKVHIGMNMAAPSSYVGYIDLTNAAGTAGWYFRWGFGRLEFGAVNLIPLTIYGIGLNVVPWHRVTRNATTGDVKFYTSSDGVNWTLLETVNQPTGLIPNMSSASIDPMIGAHGPVGNFYSITVSDKIDGAPIIDWNASYMGQTGGTGPDGIKWAIRRAASGNKTVLVERSMFLFGTDDVMIVPDNNALDIGESETLTCVTVFRKWGVQANTNPIPIGKTNSTGIQPGYYLINQQGSRSFYGQIVDTSLNVLAASVEPIIDGSFATAGVTRRYTTIGGVLGYHAGTVVNGKAHFSIGTLSSPLTNTFPFFVGSLEANQNQTDQEWFGAAFWRRALTDSELALIHSYFINPTA